MVDLDVANFEEALNLDRIIELFKDLKETPWVISYIDECCITYASILIFGKRLTDAQKILNNGLRLAKMFNLEIFYGKIKLILLSIDINKKNTINIESTLDEIEKIFKKYSHVLGLREVKLLRIFYYRIKYEVELMTKLNVVGKLMSGALTDP